MGHFGKGVKSREAKSDTVKGTPSQADPRVGIKNSMPNDLEDSEGPRCEKSKAGRSAPSFEEPRGAIGKPNKLISTTGSEDTRPSHTRPKADEENP